MAKTVYVLNGPNLNLLGTREPETYGHATLGDVETLCREAAGRRTARDRISPVQPRGRNRGFDPCRPAPRRPRDRHQRRRLYPHSVAIRDAIAAIAVPVIEVHISNVIRAREFSSSFPHRAGVAKASLCGFGIEGYAACNRGLAAMIDARQRAEGMAGERKSKDTPKTNPRGRSRASSAASWRQLLDEAGLTEIEFERDGQRVRVARQAQAVVAAPLRAPVRRPSCPFPSPRRSIPPSIRAW